MEPCKFLRKVENRGRQGPHGERQSAATPQGHRTKERPEDAGTDASTQTPDLRNAENGSIDETGRPGGDEEERSTIRTAEARQKVSSA